MCGQARFESPAHFDAVHAWHDNVEQHDIAVAALADFKRISPVGGSNNVKIFSGQPRFQQMHIGRDVVNDEDTGSHPRAPSRNAEKMANRLDEFSD